MRPGLLAALVSGAIAAPANLRLYLTANMAETGTGPYTYTASSGSAAAGGTNLCLPHNTDGSITGRLVAAAPSQYCGIGFRYTKDSAATYGGTVLFGLWANSGLTNYRIGANGGAGVAGNGPAAATVPALNDRLRITRTGSTWTFEVARDAAPNTWLLLHTVTGGSTVTAYPCVFANAAGGAIELSAWSGLSRYFDWSASSGVVAVTMDGNSLVYGYRNPGPGVTVAQNIISDAASPMFGSGITVVNSGTNGNTWAQMTGALPTFVANFLNVCIAWEGTNSIASGRTGLQAAADAAAYITALKASNPNWRVVLMTTLPREGSLGPWGTVAAFNAEVDAYNAYLRANWSAMGACALCDVRAPGSPWNISSYTQADFTAVDTAAGGTVWLESPGGRIHMTDFGDTKIAALLEPVLANVTLRDA